VAREIGYLFGQYKRIRNEFTGVFTGKGLNWGGSLIRPEATGFGAVYFLSQMLEKRKMALDGMGVAISGFGNVAWGTAMKATELGAKVVTLSGPDGYIHDPAGLNDEKIAYMLDLRKTNNDVVAPYAQKFPGSTFFPNRKPWEVPVDIAMPCACQNELNGEDAKLLIANGVKAVAEVSNMGCRPEAIAAFLEAGIPFGPGKAVNAGGVATSGLEMSQNAIRLSWSREEVNQKLHNIMDAIHQLCWAAADEFGHKGNYVMGANIAGFQKVANAMIDQGLV
jgi:glutamate dehydrogenase (NADP+)